MQVKNLSNWKDRSLSYLCRSFDQILKGSDYDTAMSTVHIGILNFTPFPDIPEFYASYKLLNEKTHHIYSDKFSLHMLDLTCIHLATPHDKACHLDDWARLFKATTWEEIKMIAKNNTDLTEASETLYTLNADYMIRKQCEARASQKSRSNTTTSKIRQSAEKFITVREGSNRIHTAKHTIKHTAIALLSLIPAVISKGHATASM